MGFKEKDTCIILDLLIELKTQIFINGVLNGYFYTLINYIKPKRKRSLNLTSDTCFFNLCVSKHSVHTVINLFMTGYVYLSTFSVKQEQYLLNVSYLPQIVVL